MDDFDDINRIDILPKDGCCYVKTNTGLYLGFNSTQQDTSRYQLVDGRGKNLLSHSNFLFDNEKQAEDALLEFAKCNKVYLCKRRARRSRKDLYSLTKYQQGHGVVLHNPKARLMNKEDVDEVLSS